MAGQVLCHFLQSKNQITHVQKSSIYVCQMQYTRRVFGHECSGFFLRHNEPEIVPDYMTAVQKRTGVDADTRKLR